MKKWNELSMAERVPYLKMGVDSGIYDTSIIAERYNKFREGGVKDNNPSKAPWYSKLDEAVSEKIMRAIAKTTHIPGSLDRYTDPKRRGMGVAQRTYLMPRFEQEDIFLESGYIKGKQGDYGLVSRAVGDRNLPVYQTAPDAISRDKLIPIGNTYGRNSSGFIHSDKDLFNAYNYPSTIYLDPITNKLYQKSWDLNDYGGSSRTTQKYDKIRQLGAKVLDMVGSPTVITTGYQEITDPYGGFKENHETKGVTIQDLFSYDDEGYPITSPIGEILDNFMKDRGLHRMNLDNNIIYALPEVTVVGKKGSKRR